MGHMAATRFLRARVTPDMKRRLSTVAKRGGVTESAWLKRLVIRELQATDDGNVEAVSMPVGTAGGSCGRGPRQQPQANCRRVYVRLRPEDGLLLEARAEARGMRPATYVSVLTRSHLRRLAPLPRDELLALRRSINELAAIGRNINQIAKFAHEGGRLPPSLRHECWAMLKVCEALRENTKGLLIANLSSWENGN